jgi:hypothetical protein
MDHRTGLSIGIILVALIAVAAYGAPAGADSHYDISVPNSIEIPDRTVELDNDEFTIRRASQVTQGDDLTITVTTSNDGYDIYLYDHDQKSEAVRPDRSGTATVEFDTNDKPAGTYYVAVRKDDIQAIYPVVIAGYTVDLNPRESTVSQGETVDIDVPVTETTSSGDLHKVQVVVGDDLQRVDATKSEGTYTATVSTDDLSAGDYPVYGVVRGEKETEGGQKIILGFSDRQTLTVTEPTATESESSGGDGGGGGGAGGGGGGGAGGGGGGGAQTATPSATPSPTDATTETVATSESPTASPTTQTTEPSASPSDSPTTTPTAEEVITPATATASESPPPSSPTPTGGQAGFGPMAVVLAVIGFLTLRRQ